MLSLRRIHAQFNNIIKILIVSDFVVWSADSMLLVVYPLFIIEEIEGGSVEIAGFASMLNLIVSAIVTIPFGILMDKMKGYIDEINFLFFSTLVRGCLLFLFIFTREIWQLFVIEILLGVVRAAMFPSWRLLFSKYADRQKKGLEWSTYDAITTVGMGISAYLGSLIFEEVSYSSLFFVMGGLTILGAFLLAFLKVFVKE